MNSKRLLLVLVLAVITACGSTVSYESPQLVERSQRHQVIAVLPFEIVLDGHAPKGLTAAQIAAIEDAESVAFQTSYYYALLNQASVHRRHPIRVGIQPAEETNRLLAAAGISIRDSWTMSAKTLAQVLRVDAVVSTSVRKTRYLSGGESFAIETGLHVVDEVTEGHLAPILPWGASRTHDIEAASEIIDAVDGSVMWQDQLLTATDWRAPANDIIASFTHELAKKFPYRS